MTDDSRRPSIATIFNPKKQKSTHFQSGAPRGRPSVVVTDEDTPRAPLQLTNGGENLRINSSPRIGSFASGRSASFNLSSLSAHHHDHDAGNREITKLTCIQKIKRCICSVTTRKIFAGFIVTFCVASSWVGATHLLKDIFTMKVKVNNSSSSSNATSEYLLSERGGHIQGQIIFDAPFFATWFCTAWTGLFFPFYLLCHTCCGRGKSSMKGAFKTISQSFRERGLTFGKFFTRCFIFCILWVGSNYLYFSSLKMLDCTDVMTLFSAHIAFVYLLAWVILHEQFVGVRIVAVILCSTGIALLAYMDGILRTHTLLGVVMGGASAAASAVHKVLFRKVTGDSNFGQIGIFFSCIAFLSTSLLSPLAAGLILLDYERVIWDRLPWLNLLLVAALYLIFSMLLFFGLAITFEVFITLGIILAVFVSGVLDVKWHGEIFEGMRLAGIILVTCGFFLVLFPANWPQYIAKILRWGRYRKRHHHRQQPEPIDYRTGLISRSHLRSPSGLIR